MESDFQKFLDALFRACSLVDDKYFEIGVAGAVDTIVRERAYCYELYHQLRISFGEEFPYKLDGELDKTNHPVLKERIGEKVPDFLVHFPGQMDKNLVVMEVKPTSARPDRMLKDVIKLQLFLEEANYYKAVFLVYGRERVGRLDTICNKIQEQSGEQIRLLWHSIPGENPTIIL